MLPIIKSPELSFSKPYSSTKRQAAIRARARCACGPSNSKFESSQCSYRFGMRAEASNESARDFRRQSQRTTRRLKSPDFHPLPPQTGQTSAATFMNRLFFECAPGDRVCASAQTWNGCAQPVELWKACGEPGTLSGGTRFFCDALNPQLFFVFSRRALFHNIAHHL